ncbi:MAG: FRG domain-containing protein, partial [Solirubrobacteraceae bacterium]
MHLDQLFGTICTGQGEARAMLCMDADCPEMCTLQWWNEANHTGYALVTNVSWNGDDIQLIPAQLHRVNNTGAIQPLVPFNEQEDRWFRTTTAQLKRVGRGLEGKWNGPDDATGLIKLDPISEAARLIAERIETWKEFRDWAYNVRQEGKLVWFRGHGSNEFSLRTTLHRLNISRLERYCYTRLTQFSLLAEAALSRRFDLNNPYDYATVLGLARHHGMPTPLLDWTASPYIAAFFAFADALERSVRPGCSDFVRIYGLTKEFIELRNVPQLVIPWVKPYAHPFMIGPLYNPRIAAQQSCFVVTNVDDFEGLVRSEEARLKTQSLHAIDVDLAPEKRIPCRVIHSTQGERHDEDDTGALHARIQ